MYTRCSKCNLIGHKQCTISNCYKLFLELRKKYKVKYKHNIKFKKSIQECDIYSEDFIVNVCPKIETIYNQLYILELNDHDSFIFINFSKPYCKIENFPDLKLKMKEYKFNNLKFKVFSKGFNFKYDPKIYDVFYLKPIKIPKYTVILQAIYAHINKGIDLNMFMKAKMITRNDKNQIKNVLKYIDNVFDVNYNEDIPESLHSFCKKNFKAKISDSTVSWDLTNFKPDDSLSICKSNLSIINHDTPQKYKDI